MENIHKKLINNEQKCILDVTILLFDLIMIRPLIQEKICFYNQIFTL